MKTKLKRFGAWLMAAALAFAGAGAVQAAEVHVSDAAGLKTAFANATADTTIVLDADITTKEHLSCEKDCVLDLAGHKIVGDYGGGDMFASGTLINVKGTSSFKLISSVSGGGMSVEGVKSFTGKYNGLAVNLASTATVTFGEADGSKADFTLYGAYQGMNISGTVIFNGGSFECGADGVAVQLQSGCNVIMNGGSISSIKGLESATVTVGAGKALACLTSGGKPQLCDIPSEGLDLSYGQIIIGLANGGNYLVKQSDKTKSANTLTICADAGVAGTVAIDGLVIDQSDAIVCKSGEGATINLELDGETKLGLAASATYGGGVRNPGDGLLVIQDENDVPGSLTAVGKSGAAAIGGASSPHSAVANITIKGGTIVATAVHGAAIGSGNEGAASNIKILGGTVTATSEYGAGIGGGNKAHAENIIISGGTVVASSARGQAVGSGFECGDDNAGISIFCGTYSPAPTADMIAAGYEVIEKDGEFIIGVKTEDDVVITTGTQETKVDVSSEVVKDQEVAQKIAQGTKVEGVNLTADTEQKKGGIQTVLETAKTQDQEFAAAVAEAAEVSVKVEVEVKPTEFDNTQDKGKVAFKLTPKATVTVGEGEGKLEREVPVTNDMIDQNQKIAVSIYTGFKPVAITHDDDDGFRIETFEGEQISFNEATGVATVLISHFSTVTGFGLAEDVPPAKVPPVAKIGDVEYETLDAAFGAAKSGETVVILNGEHDCTADNAFAKLCAKTVTLKGESQAGTVLNMGRGNKTGVQTTSGPGTHLTLEDMTLKFDHSGSGSPMYDHTFYHPASQTFRRVTIVGQIDIMDDTLFDTCTFTGKVNDKDEYLLWCYGCKAELVNCTFTGTGVKAPIKLYNEGAQCGLKVAETSFAKVGSYGCAVYSSNDYPNNNVYEITVGENVTVPAEAEKGLIRSNSTGLTVINPTKDENGKYTGGTFESEKKSGAEIAALTEKYAAEGFEPVVDPETGKVIVEDVMAAQIGETKYATLQAAAEAAVAGNTITLLKDYTVGEGENVAIKNGVTFTAGSYTLTCTGAGSVSVAGVTKFSAGTYTGTLVLGKVGEDTTLTTDGLSVAPGGIIKIVDGSVVTLSGEGFTSDSTGGSFCMILDSLSEKNENPHDGYTLNLDNADGFKVGCIYLNGGSQFNVANGTTGAAINWTGGGDGYLNVYGGTVTIDETSDLAPTTINLTGLVDVKGVLDSCTVNIFAGITGKQGGEIKVEGGAFTNLYGIAIGAATKDGAKYYIDGDDQTAKLTLIGGTVNSKESVNNCGLIVMDAASSIETKNFTGNNGVVQIDMTGATADSYTLISASGTANYGSVGTNYKFAEGKDYGYQLKVVNNSIVAEKMPVAVVVSGDGTATNEYNWLSAALTDAQAGEKVILIADTAEENVPLKLEQEIILNGHAFTGTVNPALVPAGYDAMVTTPDGKVFSAPAKVSVEIGEGASIKVRMLDTAQNLSTEQANGRPLWANKALGIENDFKILPVVERPAVGSKTISIRSNIPDSVLEAAAQQRDGVSVKFQLAKKVGSAGTYVQFGEKQPKPEFTVEADEQEVQTFWKIQIFFEEEY